ncbi:site-specific integrase [Geomonas subterranea]|uniref:Site-specific integrase n=1 Tax=Geomonas subterranea TaxID=2847989 RepID=A0ABX8LQJ2_9BACT|nr:site-specific integrase [Geomonas subterranea]QXE92559.1 site-specific integrase [Geomonas subterranea]QXM09343.1 site-specific integrase [Geomonas subterranea]
MSSYLISRNGHYHLRVRTPLDLLGIIPQTEITRSLKTTDLRKAKAAALPYLQGISQTVILLRSKFITSLQAQESLCNLLGRKGRGVSRAVDRAAQKATMEVSPSPSEGATLATVVTTFLKDKELEWTPKTRMENKGVFRLILGLMGDVPVASIDRGRVRDFREQLLKLPPNVSKTYPEQSPLEILQRIDSGELLATPMSITSVNKHLSRLYSIMSYCIKEGYRTDNPASEMNIKQHRRPDEERKAYDLKDLRAILRNLPRDSSKPERLYVPMICMLSGMRLDEACQLYREDIIQVDGIWCFDVNDCKDKKVKNLSSKRMLPVHPVLINMGFLDHVGKCREGSRLWGNLKWCKVNGYSNSFGKWYQRFNRKHVTTDPLKTFHSLRHTFADTLKQQGVQENLISELMGHANSSITTGRYGKRYRAQGLLEAICKLDYCLEKCTTPAVCSLA